MTKVQKTDQQWRQELTPEQYRVLREKGTEAPFSGEYDHTFEPGTYHCAGCGAELFVSETKYDSGCGWPAFYAPRVGGGDRRGGRRDVRDGSHRGHVLELRRASRSRVSRRAGADGPALLHQLGSTQTGGGVVEKKATFGAGCFWGVEAAFRQIDGVTKTRVGYSGGTLENPTYEDVCSHTTGHAEVVEVTYDPEQVSYEQLLDVFWGKHDPTQLNRQGWDIGDQYRSVIFFHDEDQREAATRSKAQRAGELEGADRDAGRARADVLRGGGLPPAVPREARDARAARQRWRIRPSGQPRFASRELVLRGPE